MDSWCRWNVFLPYNNKLTKYEPDRTLPASRLVIDTLKENGVAKYNAAHFKAEPFITSMEFKDDLIKQVGSIERLYAQIIMDTAMNYRLSYRHVAC